MASDDSQFEPRSVGLVSPGWPAEAMANGIVSYVAAIARGLSALGVDCHILTERPMGQFDDPRVHVIAKQAETLASKIMWRVDPQGWPQRKFAAALLNEVRALRQSGGLQLLEIEESYGWARLLADRCPVPLVVRLHGPWFLNGVANGAPRDKAFARRDRWEKAGIKAAGAISAPSLHVLQETRKHFGLELAGAEVIPNPVEPVGVSDRWNLAACDRNRIVFVGRFDRHKGGDLMIDAFARIVSRFPDARLDFIGPDRGCRDEQGRTWTIEEYLSAKLGADRAKVTYHGFLPGPAAAQMRKRALVTVAPSRYETFGIATAEAMMAGCPTVVCAAGALNELVQDGLNGLCAAPQNAADVARCVMSLMSDPARAARLGDAAANDAHQRYAPAVVARQTADFYRRVLREAPRRLSAEVLTPVSPRPASVSA